MQWEIAGGSWREKVNAQEMCVEMQFEKKEPVNKIMEW